MKKSRQAMATAVLFCAGLAIVATSEKRWERRTTVGGALTIPPGATSVQTSVVLRLSPATASAGTRPRFQLRLQVPAGFRANLSPPQGAGSNAELVSVATYYPSQPCSAPSCEATFRVQWTRTNPSAEANNAPWTGEGEFSAAGDDPSNARLEGIVTQ